MTDTERFKVTKKQLRELLQAVDGTDFQEVTLTSITVEGKRGILAKWTEFDQMGDVSHRALVIGDGVVKL